MGVERYLLKVALCISYLEDWISELHGWKRSTGHAGLLAWYVWRCTNGSEDMLTVIWRIVAWDARHTSEAGCTAAEEGRQRRVFMDKELQRWVEERWCTARRGGNGQRGGGGDGERRGRKIKFTTRGISQTRGSPYGSFRVLCPRGWYIFIGKKNFPHLHQLAIWY